MSDTVNVFAVAAEALRETLYSLENHTVSLRDIEKRTADTKTALATMERYAAVSVEAFTATYRHEEGLSFRTALMVPVDHRFDFSSRWHGVTEADHGKERFSVDGDPAWMAEHEALCQLAAARSCRQLNAEVAR